MIPDERKIADHFMYPDGIEIDKIPTSNKPKA